MLKLTYIDSVRTDWQSVLAESVRSPAELCRLLGLNARVGGRGRTAAGGFSLLARGRTWPASVPAIRPIRCCSRSCPGRPNWPPRGLPARSARRGRLPLRTRSAAEVPRPNLDGNNWGVCRPLPLLLPAALSLPKIAPRPVLGAALREIATDRSIRGGDPQRRRPVDAARRRLGPAGRRIGRNPAPPPAANPQPAAGDGPPTGDRRVDLLDSRESAFTHDGGPREPSGRDRPGGGRGLRTAGRRGHPRVEPVGAAAGRQRSGRRAGRIVPAAGRPAGDSRIICTNWTRWRGRPISRCPSRPALP